MKARGGIQNSAAVLFRILLLLVVILVKVVKPQLTFKYLRICDTDKTDTVDWCGKKVHSVVSFLNFIVSRTFTSPTCPKQNYVRQLFVRIKESIYELLESTRCAGTV